MQTTMKILRERAGITQKELARALGVAQPNVSAWENGLRVMPAARQTQVAKILAKAGFPLRHAADLLSPWDETLWRDKMREAIIS